MVHPVYIFNQHCSTFAAFSVYIALLAFLSAFWAYNIECLLYCTYTFQFVQGEKLNHRFSYDLINTVRKDEILSVLPYRKVLIFN